MELDYTVPTAKSHADAVAAVVDMTAAHGFRVQFVHDVQETLAEKGFTRDPLTIIEMCNAKFASQVLAADPKIGLMLPCPIMVYVEGDQTLISTMRPTLIGGFFPDAGIADTAAEVEQILFAIIDEAAA
jgi:uncharacterized protein (DUF302 family)